MQQVCSGSIQGMRTINSCFLGELTLLGAFLAAKGRVGVAPVLLRLADVALDADLVLASAGSCAATAVPMVGRKAADRSELIAWSICMNFKGQRRLELLAVQQQWSHRKELALCSRKTCAYQFMSARVRGYEQAGVLYLELTQQEQDCLLRGIVLDQGHRAGWESSRLVFFPRVKQVEELSAGHAHESNASTLATLLASLTLSPPVLAQFVEYHTSCKRHLCPCLQCSSLRLSIGALCGALDGRSWRANRCCLFDFECSNAQGTRRARLPRRMHRYYHSDSCVESTSPPMKSRTSRQLLGTVCMRRKPRWRNS